MDKALRADVDTRLAAATTDLPAADGSSVRVHVGGVDQWRDPHDWPPPDHQLAAWHLHAGGRLRTSPANESLPTPTDTIQATPPPRSAAQRDHGPVGTVSFVSRARSAAPATARPTTPLPRQGSNQ